MPDQLQNAIDLLKAGDILSARWLLRDVVKSDPNNAEAWLWLARSLSDQAHRRDCLERVLKLDPDNQEARQALAKLDRLSEQPPERKQEPKPEPDSLPIELQPFNADATSVADSTDQFSPPSPAEVQPAGEDQPPAAASTAALITPPMGLERSEEIAEAVSPKQPVQAAEAVSPGLPEQSAEAASPSRALNNVWLNPANKPDKVVILDDGSLIVANPGRRAFDKFRAETEAGSLHYDLLGANTLFIPYNSIIRVVANAYQRIMVVRFRSGRNIQTERVRFAAIALRDEVFEALRLDAGSRFELTHIKRIGILVSLPYLLIAALLGYLTYNVYITATRIAAGWTYPILETNPQIKAAVVQAVWALGPLGLTIIGGVLTLVTLLWAIRRGARPPNVKYLNPR